MTIGTKIYTFFQGVLIGEDQFGNRYYESRAVRKTTGRKRRWVQYKGSHEPSKVCPAWHGWLHYTTDRIPKESYAWQKEHVPNLTGTSLAYRPPGHILKGGKRQKATGDYEAWKPNR